MDSSEINLPKVLKERLNREKAYLYRGSTELCDTRHAIPFIFDTDPPPDVAGMSGKIEPVTQPLGAFGEDLERMPMRHHHHAGYRDDVLVGDTVLEEITHRGHEHHPWCCPAKWL